MRAHWTTHTNHLYAMKSNYKLAEMLNFEFRVFVILLKRLVVFINDFIILSNYQTEITRVYV